MEMFAKGELALLALLVCTALDQPSWPTITLLTKTYLPLEEHKKYSD